MIKRQLRLARRPVPRDEILRKQVLERMIMDKIQLQYAERTGVSVADDDAERAFAAIAQSNKLSPAQLRQALERDGIDYRQFLDNLRNQLVLRKLIERDINNRVSVSDSEIDNFLLTSGEGAGMDAEYNLSHILVAIPEKATPDVIAAARKRAESVHARLKGGMDFEQAAIEYSQSRDALDGGSLGWKKAGELPELFVDALRSLQPGGISEVLRSPNGFHIVKLNDQRGAGAEAVVQTHARHILIRPTAIVSPADAMQRVRQLRARIQNGEDFAALAKANSDDVASAVDGGDLGWITPGTMVPQFEQAMAKLKPGELSEPVVTRYGVHLIEVLERRSQDVTGERERAAARQQIHERKAKEMYEQWLRQLHDEAFIEYHTDVDQS
jgi:peptidyl-prolyl cis-trans isomerase SurA